MTHEWIETEMKNLNTKNKRLDQRTKKALKSIINKPDAPFPQQFQSAAELKACYNLFNSDLITSEVILNPHIKKTVERIQSYKVLILAGDSSSVNYTTRDSNPDSGYISSNNAQGFFLHVSLATTLERQPLGVVQVKFWAREKVKPEKKVHRDYLPIEEKESCKWLESFEIANQIAIDCPNTQIINVYDREADIIELWEKAIIVQQTKNHAHLVVRCNHNRAIQCENNKKIKLFEFAEESPVIDHCEFELRDRSTHKVLRMVKQEVRASSVCIQPAYRSGVKNRKVVLNIVFLKEINCPERAEPVNWYLLTTLPIENEEDVQKIIRAYLARWDIEILFRTFKSGCNVEKRSLRNADRLYPMFALFLIVAWRINSMSKISRINPELPCTVVFSEIEARAAYAALNKTKEIPKTLPTIREMIIMIARLGGYLNRKSDPEPGATVIWRGLKELQIYVSAFEILQPLEDYKK